LRVEQFVQNFVDGLATNNASRAYVNTLIKRLRTFFRVNGYSNKRELSVKTYFLPARYRKVPEYIPTTNEVLSMANAAGSQRNRAIILTLWSSGIRVSTLCALNYGDVAEELESGELHVTIHVYPKMKERVYDACKGKIPYYTFIV
jgi:site-specific recombinase XerD